MNVGEWKERLAVEREQKDQFFALHPQSPISVESRPSFTGLDYFPPDPGYRFELPIHEHDKKETVEVEDTAGNTRRMIRWGEFRFKIGEQECELQGYRTDASEEGFFIPFRDATSGKETYGAGRYLDLQADEHLTDRGTWIVDLNRAYNPWCAYSEHYACPFVLPENWLQVPVHAGEKSYGAERRH